MKPVGTVVLVIVAVVIGYAIGQWGSLSFVWSTQGKIWTWISVAGAFGGMLYTFRDGGVVTPHKDPTRKYRYNLGWISDCAYGIAGAYVIFLLVPTEIGTGSSGDSVLLKGSVFDQMRLIALALVGGYGGRSLVDRALANLVKKIDDVQESTNKIVADKETDAHALELVQLHLDEEEKPQDHRDLKTAVAAASRGVRFEIFKQARSVRTSNWKRDPLFMERTIPIFEALIENEAGEVFHRNHAQLGYALKDMDGSHSRDKDWSGAYAQLDKAIHLRNQEGDDLHRADGSPSFLMYEFNRAICAIELGKDKSEILADLKAACRRDSLRKAISSDKIFRSWADRNDVNIQAFVDENTPRGGDDPEGIS